MTPKRSSFEDDFRATYPEVRRLCGWTMFTLYPEFRPVGHRGRCPIFVPTGRALFDEAGWTHDGLFIGVELKSSRAAQTSLRIRGADRESGEGLQWHQLDALAALARTGGLALVLWRNGGTHLGLSKARLIEAHERFLRSELARRKDKGRAIRGCHTIPVDLFTPLESLVQWPGLLR